MNLLMANATPSVTVITPAYNCGRYLQDCVASVARQAGVVVQHILINDASTDDTAETLDALAKELPTLQVQHLSENLGQARVRNIGVRAARADYILFLDADDCLEGPHSLKAVLDSAQSNAADLVHFQYNRMLESTGETSPAQNRLPGDTRAEGASRDFPQLIHNTACWQMMYRRAFLEREEILFSDRLRQREDRPFFLECLLKAQSVNIIQDRVVRYRVRSGSTMGTLDLAQLEMFTIHLELIGRLMQALGESPQERVLKRANMLYYMHVMLSYWGPFLLRSEVRKSRQAKAFFAAWQSYSWSASDLFSDDIIGNIPTRHRDSGLFDALAHLLATGQTQLALSLMRDERLSVREVEDLSHSAQHAATRFAFSTDAFALFASNIRLRLDKKPLLRPRSKRPRLILHIGSTKTGSSALQKFMEVNRFALLRDHGLYYPMSGLENGRGARSHRTSGHATLMANLIAGHADALDKLMLELGGLSRAPKTVFLSCENILSSRFWDKGAVAAQLAPMLSGFDLTLLAYLRNPVDWLESMYAESVASPGLRLTQSPRDFYKAQEALGLLNCQEIADCLRKNLPQAKLILRSYDQLRASKTSITTDVLSALGLSDIDPSAYAAPAKKFNNISIPKQAVCLIRTANNVALQREAVLPLNAALVAHMHSQPDLAKTPGYFYDTALATEISDRHQAQFSRFFAPDTSAPASLLDRPNINQNLQFTPADLEVLGDEIAKAKTWKLAAEDVELPAPTQVDAAFNDAFQAYVNSDTFLSRLRRSRPEKNRLKMAHALRESGLFDDLFYVSQLPKAADYQGGPLFHYLDHWEDLLLDPHRHFSTRDYLMINTDVAESGLNPFYHYIAFGKAEGRKTIDV